MTPLRSLNPLESVCSHGILSIFPLCPFVWLSVRERGAQLVSFTFSSGPISLCAQAPRCCCSAALPDWRVSPVSPSFPFSIHLASASYSATEEEKALKNIRIHIKWSSSGVSRGPSDLEICSWACSLFLSSCCFFHVIFIFILHKTRCLWLPQSVWTIPDPNGLLADELLRSGEVTWEPVFHK